MRILLCRGVWAAVVLMPLLAAASATAADAARDFAVQRRLPPATVEAVQTLLDWQRTQFDLEEAHVIERFGAPDERRPLAAPASHQLIYHLTRRSNLEITITRGEVAAMAMIVMPSRDEAGPVDD